MKKYYIFLIPLFALYSYRQVDKKQKIAASSGKKTEVKEKPSCCQSGQPKRFVQPIASSLQQK